MWFPAGIYLLIKYGAGPDNSEWIGFFGSYLGAIVGAIVALAISRMQTRSSRDDLRIQIKNQEQLVTEQLAQEKHLQRMENRTFVDYTMFQGPLLMEGRPGDSTRILLHERISLIIKSRSNEWLQKQKALFIKVDYYGKAPCILDVHFTMEIQSEEEAYTITAYKNGINKEDHIFIPVSLAGGTEQLTKLEVKYTTLFNENLMFVSDLINKIERYYSLEGGVETLLYEREFNSESYMFPGNTEDL
ncbi:hypothetical protein [Halobacillus sp. A5]|uniref:hypothetical protein n=1 Tax=Halobacillus sp. A5 TaxID=2880263 RepID=UPI0020A6CC2B|nr:hypothetical protein [Halobacillus sp. A5]MCP3029682.1 hypothetical protein [Halobacillus sp. A5]